MMYYKSGNLFNEDETLSSGPLEISYSAKDGFMINCKSIDDYVSDEIYSALRPYMSESYIPHKASKQHISSKGGCGISYRKISDDDFASNDEDQNNTEEQVSYHHTNELKAAQKKLIKTKFVVGNIYALRTKSKDGSKKQEKTFECKKFIYTVNDHPVNIVIMKQLSGEQSKIFTLNKHDCELYHIKYEDGLQVWPMTMKWINIKQKEQ